MFQFKTLFHTAVLGLALSSTTHVLAGEAFGKQYTPVATVSATQSQIVFYRPAVAKSLNGAANVYVDREFHTALLPNGFSTVCVAAGTHNLGAYLGDAPQYKGKTAQADRFTLAGGTTYFLKVEEGANAPAKFILRADAEHELANSRQQIQALSRASTVQACDYSLTDTAFSQ